MKTIRVIRLFIFVSAIQTKFVPGIKGLNNLQIFYKPRTALVNRIKKCSQATQHNRCTEKKASNNKNTKRKNKYKNILEYQDCFIHAGSMRSAVATGTAGSPRQPARQRHRSLSSTHP